MELFAILLESEGDTGKEIDVLKRGERSREELAKELTNLNPKHLASGGRRTRGGSPGKGTAQRIIRPEELEA